MSSRSYTDKLSESFNLPCSQRTCLGNLLIQFKQKDVFTHEWTITTWAISPRETPLPTTSHGTFTNGTISNWRNFASDSSPHPPPDDSIMERVKVQERIRGTASRNNRRGWVGLSGDCFYVSSSRNPIKNIVSIISVCCKF